MSSLGFRSDAAAAAATSEGSAPGPSGETPLTPVSEFPRWKPHRAPRAVAVGGVPGKLQGEGLPPPVGKATQKTEDRRTAGTVVLPQGQSPAWPPPLLLALSFNPETSASPSGSRLTTVGTLHTPSQPGQDGTQEVGSEAEPLALTGPLLAEVEARHYR